MSRLRWFPARREILPHAFVLAGIFGLVGSAALVDYRDQVDHTEALERQVKAQEAEMRAALERVTFWEPWSTYECVRDLAGQKECSNDPPRWQTMTIWSSDTTTILPLACQAGTTLFYPTTTHPTPGAITE